MPTITVKNVPTDLYEQLKKSAKANRRSINSEVIVCIERAVLSRKVRPEVMLPRARELREKTSDYIAVYEQGILRPLTTLALDEHARVRLQIIEQVADADLDHPLLALAELGESQENDISERAEEILSAEVKPDVGWSTSDADHR